MPRSIEATLFTNEIAGACATNSFVTVTAAVVPSPIVICEVLKVDDTRFNPETVRATSRKFTTVPNSKVGPDTTVPLEFS